VEFPLLRWWKSACGGAIRPGWCSDHEGQLGERVSEAGSERCLGPEVVEASAKVLDEGMPGDDDPGGAITLQPPYGPESSLQPSVVDDQPDPVSRISRNSVKPQVTPE